MTTSMYLSLRVVLLFLMQTSPRYTQSYIKDASNSNTTTKCPAVTPSLILEFEDVSDRLTALLGSVVNITFHLNTHCLQKQPTHKIRISNESSREIFCDFIPSETCTAHPYRGASCSCLSPKRTMVFSKKVSMEDNNTVYLWRLWDTNLKDLETKRISFLTYSETKTTTSKQVIRDAGTTTEVKALESKSEFALIYHPNVVVIISATFCVCLVVISVAVATGVVCYKRARTLYYRPETPNDMNTSFAYLNYALEGVNSSRHQARDIYEEIPDPPKKNRRSRVDSTASSKLGVKLPPIPVEDATTQSPTKETQLSSYFDGYLHTAPISDATPVETREFRDNPTVQSS